MRDPYYVYRPLLVSLYRPFDVFTGLLFVIGADWAIP